MDFMEIEESNICLWQMELGQLDSLKSNRQVQLELRNRMKNKHCKSKSPISSTYFGCCVSEFKKLGK